MVFGLLIPGRARRGVRPCFGQPVTRCILGLQKREGEDKGADAQDKKESKELERLHIIPCPCPCLRHCPCPWASRSDLGFAISLSR